MRIITKDEYNLKKEKFLSKIRGGAVFIYPTDTIYGIGANALNHDSVKKIRDAKQNQDRPFSIIAPSKEWIKENCEINDKAKEWLEKLPGPYTLILRLKNKDAVEHNVNPSIESIGIRIPDHWCSDIVRDIGFPIITTSANLTSQGFMTSVENLNVDIRNKTDFMINQGEIKGKPSTLIDLTKEEISIKER